VKYKASKVIPQLIRKLNTLSPTEIASEASTEYNKKVSATSISMWIQRHPQIRQELSQELQKSAPIVKTTPKMAKLEPKVLAELYVNNSVLFEVKDLHSLDCARKYLDMVEAFLKT
jgi:hypothetical protein